VFRSQGAAALHEEPRPVGDTVRTSDVCPGAADALAMVTATTNGVVATTMTIFSERIDTDIR
jgi:hypothetical protein